jgi:hypothetical protein
MDPKKLEVALPPLADDPELEARQLCDASSV